jgi:hypothetical protein
VATWASSTTPSSADPDEREPTASSDNHRAPQGLPTGLNGTQSVPTAPLGAPSTHLLEPNAQVVHSKRPGWSGLSRYVRIVEVAGSSPVTSTRCQNHNVLAAETVIRLSGRSRT